MESNFQKKLFAELELFWSPLVHTGGEPEEVLELFLQLGWDIGSITSSEANLGNFLDKISAVINSLSVIEQYATSTPPQTLPEIAQALNDLAPITQQVRGLKFSIGSTLPELDDLAKDLLDKLFLLYLSRRFPSTYHFLDFITVIHYAPAVEVEFNNAVVRTTEGLPTLDLGRLSNFLADPYKLLKNEYWPTDIPDQATATAVGEKLFTRISRILGYAGIVAHAGRSSGAKPTHLDEASWDKMRGLLTLRQKYFNALGGFNELGAVVGLLPATEGGPGAFIVPFGNTEISKAFGNWLFAVNLGTDLPGLKFLGDGEVDIIDSALSKVAVQLTVQYLNDNPDDRVVKIGSTTGTRLEIGALALKAFLNKSSDNADYGVLLSFHDAAFILKAGDGDGFLQKILPPGDNRLAFNLGLGWAKNRGIFFNGSAGLEINYPFTSGKKADRLKLQALQVVIRANENGLMVWSPVLWVDSKLDFPTWENVQPNLPSSETISNENIISEDGAIVYESEHFSHLEAFEIHKNKTIAFWNSLHKVRRALANVPSYMMWDDHEITDDWFIDLQWCEDVLGLSNVLGRRIVQNGMSAAAVFQFWGNDPAHAAFKSRMGDNDASLLQELKNLSVKSTTDQLAIFDRIGSIILPEFIRNSTNYGYNGSELSFSADFSFFINFGYLLLIALETRSKRFFPHVQNSNLQKKLSPALLSETAMTLQLENKLVNQVLPQGVQLTLVIAPAPIIGHTFMKKKVQPFFSDFESPRFADRESWSNYPPCFEAVLDRLSYFKQVVVLSGDVHYSFTADVKYWNDRAISNQFIASIKQLTASASKNSDYKTKALAKYGSKAWMLKPQTNFVGWKNEVNTSVLPLRNRLGNLQEKGWQGQWIFKRISFSSPYVYEFDSDDEDIRFNPDFPPQWRYRISFIGGVIQDFAFG